METLKVLLPNLDTNAQQTTLTATDVLAGLLEHELVASASYENGEFHVIPKDPAEKPFSFRLTFAEEKGTAGHA